MDVEISRMIPERKSLYPGEIDVGTVLRHFRKIPGVNFGALSIATEHDTRESLAVVVEVIASHFDDILVDDAPLLALMDDIRVLKAEDMREHNRRAKEARQRLRREGRL